MEGEMIDNWVQLWKIYSGQFIDKGYDLEGIKDLKPHELED